MAFEYVVITRLLAVLLNFATHFSTFVITCQDYSSRKRNIVIGSRSGNFSLNRFRFINLHFANLINSLRVKGFLIRTEYGFVRKIMTDGLAHPVCLEIFKT